MKKHLQMALAIVSLCALAMSPVSGQMVTSGARTWSSIANAAGTVIATVFDLTNNDAVAVAIVDGNGSQITSFGGGTQYAEDTPGADADVVTLAGGRRQDTLTTDTSADGDRTHLKFNNVGALWAQINGGNVGLSTGSNVIGKASVNSTCGTTAFDQVWAAVPTSATSVTGSTTCNLEVIVANTNSTAQTILITDGQGSPITIVPTLSIPGNSLVRFQLGKATTGFKWTAGGSGLTGAASGVQ